MCLVDETTGGELRLRHIVANTRTIWFQVSWRMDRARDGDEVRVYKRLMVRTEADKLRTISFRLMVFILAIGKYCSYKCSQAKPPKR